MGFRYTPPRKQLTENLLINPRGKINQLAEPQGVIGAGEYFCDGWKAGDNGAEVYVDSDGFRLVSGSIVQLVPNSLDVGQTIRSGLDIVSGTPQMSINGGTNNEKANNAEYIRLEVSGDNSKFTRLILAPTKQPPVYTQERDEMTPCLRFLVVNKETMRRPFCVYASGYAMVHILDFPQRMHKVPAVNIWISSAASSLSSGWSEISDRVQASKDGMTAIIRNTALADHQVAYVAVNHIVADARP
ncbi:hypothetical protein [Vibrio sp. HN007]|uniref:hypothetical protein n=1 Tax=Vibrio iocasae TaxID=3098914 RepID=UPI0035D4939B